MPTIKISAEQWKKMNSLKDNASETFEDVLAKLLTQYSHRTIVGGGKNK
jgi:predicted CopG family antitoxin